VNVLKKINCAILSANIYVADYDDVNQNTMPQ